MTPAGVTCAWREYSFAAIGIRDTPRNAASEHCGEGQHGGQRLVMPNCSPSAEENGNVYYREAV